MIPHDSRAEVNKDILPVGILRPLVLPPGSWSGAKAFFEVCQFGTSQPADLVLYCTMMMVKSPALMATPHCH